VRGEQAARQTLRQPDSPVNDRRGKRPVEARRHRRLVGSRGIGERRLDRVHPRGERKVPEPAKRAGGADHRIAAGDDHAREGIKRPYPVHGGLAGRLDEVVGRCALRLLRCEGSRTDDHYEYHHDPTHVASYRSANFTPWVPARTSPMIHAAIPARLAAVITASVSSRAATAIIPMPRLNTRRISPSDTSPARDRKSTRLNSSHVKISYAVFCLKNK